MGRLADHCRVAARRRYHAADRTSYRYLAHAKRAVFNHANQRGETVTEIASHDGAGAPSARHVAYLFEAKGIQRWILQGGRLRDITAASNLLARAASSDTNDLLESILGQAQFAPQFSRRAGGAFMLHYDGRDAR